SGARPDRAETGHPDPGSAAAPAPSPDRGAADRLAALCRTGLAWRDAGIPHDAGTLAPYERGAGSGGRKTAWPRRRPAGRTADQAPAAPARACPRAGRESAGAHQRPPAGVKTAVKGAWPRLADGG